jgi:hypothetical protein
MNEPASPAEFFAELLDGFLNENPALRCERKEIGSRLWGARYDYLFRRTSEGVCEVWATVHENQDQISVGIGGRHMDFEAFGRPISNADLAQEAFTYLVSALNENQYIETVT